jgi:hypothetical protein
MPYSTNYFKDQTKNYILNKYPKDTRILDIGAGCGTYSDLLKPEGYTNIDCVEAFYDYVVNFNLKDKYKNLYIGDVTKLNIDFTQYDLIILGDVLEHISTQDAQALLSKIKTNTIIGVPFLSPQDAHFNNDYEIHLQEDLTFTNFFERYGLYYPLCLRFDYGIFVKEPTFDLSLYVETNQNPLPEEFKNEINFKFSNLVIKDIGNNVSIPQPVSIETNKVTIVTGIWNMGRGEINESFKRPYQDYLDKMALILATDIPMYIFADKSDEEFIWKHRKKENTVLNIISLNELKEWFNFTNRVNEIRKDEKWLSQVGWLRESPQASLDSYNPVVMSKMFMLNNVTIWNPLNSVYFFWIDAGIANTVSYGYFTHDKVFNNLPDFIDANEDFVFLTYPYEGGGEIHGFEREAIARYANTDYVKFVCRGGFFGGKKERINEINGLYYSYLNNTLTDGYMGTEESVFSIILYNHPELVTQYLIEGNGLVWPFFEDLKDKQYKKNVVLRQNNKTYKVSLYVLTFNSPNQFKTLIESMKAYDENFLTNPRKILLDNSTDSGHYSEYKSLCEYYGFEHIKKDNLGICGGRQFIAEHFAESDSDYMMFFEDDMFFYPKHESCRNGFKRFDEKLYTKSLEIISKENLDFLKLNFSEFYGDNSTQWAWYNVPQNVRELHWPNKNKLPEHGLDPNAPRTHFNNIKIHNGIAYATGEVYYCNWPQIVSKVGSKKMFLDTTWAHPFEQTWMSYIFQKTITKEITSGILLMTPTEHNRFDFYEGSQRKES